MRNGSILAATAAIIGFVAFFVWSDRAGERGLNVVANAPTPATTATSTAEPTVAPEPTSTPAPTPTLTPPPLGATSCDTDGSDEPAGTTSTISGSAATAGSGPIRTFSIEVEDGLAIDGDCFGREVERVLFDERSWVGTGEVTWQRVDADPDTRIILASPATTDQLCVPFQTNGVFSCTIEQVRTVFNVNRWRNGATDFLGIEEYRVYLINHEIGHALEHNHVGCPGAGLPAPVMMQQTKSVDSCLANAWPLRDDTEG